MTESRVTIGQANVISFRQFCNDKRSRFYLSGLSTQLKELKTFKSSAILYQGNISFVVVYVVKST